MTTMSARRALRWPAVVLATAALAACGGRSGAAHHARYGSSAPASPQLVRGTVSSVSPGDLVVRTNTGAVTVELMRPVQVYRREPASLADVKNGVFIGVTTVKQPDGSEQATEIHVFPEALRGLGEGSYMMTQSPGGSRMTNGAARMTNGAVSASRMTNGAVSGSGMSSSSSSATGSLTVQYTGGSLKVTVPPNTQVTRIVASTQALAPGEQVVVPVSRGPNGSLSTNRVLLIGK